MEALLISRTKAEKNPSLLASNHIIDFSENDIKVAIEESVSSMSDIKKILIDDGFENKSKTLVDIVPVEDNEEDSAIDGLEMLYFLDTSASDYSIAFSETSVSAANEYEKSLTSKMKQALVISTDNNSDNEPNTTAKTTSDENNEEKPDIDADTGE